MTTAIKLKIDKNTAPTIEIDMWEIKGDYADGKWHILIHNYINAWLNNTNFNQTATLWSVVAGSVNFNHNGNSCFIAAFGIPDDFLVGLQECLATEFPTQVRLSDEFLVTRNDGWRPYLHIEKGNSCKPWEEEY